MKSSIVKKLSGFWKELDKVEHDHRNWHTQQSSKNHFQAKVINEIAKFDPSIPANFSNVKSWADIKMKTPEGQMVSYWSFWISLLCNQIEAQIEYAQGNAKDGARRFADCEQAKKQGKVIFGLSPAEYLSQKRA